MIHLCQSDPVPSVSCLCELSEIKRAAGIVPTALCHGRAQGLRARAAAAVLADVRIMISLVESAGAGRGHGDATDQQRSDESELLEGHDNSPVLTGGGTHLQA
jgi:hypothetical protein